MSTNENIPGGQRRGVPTPAAFGRRLALAREGLQLSLEDAAHQTRIHSRRLRWLEEGNIAAFGCITYARSFIRAYSAFLGVDPARFLQTLPERGQLGGRGNYRYLTESQGCWLRERDSAHSPLREAREAPAIQIIKSPIPAGARTFGIMLAATVFWTMHLLDTQASMKAGQPMEPTSQLEPMPLKSRPPGQAVEARTAIAAAESAAR
jgi:transcriptional regulator with XRE-family HTH domain